MYGNCYTFNNKDNETIHSTSMGGSEYGETSAPRRPGRGAAADLGRAGSVHATCTHGGAPCCVSVVSVPLSRLHVTFRGALGTWRGALAPPGKPV